MTVVKPPDEVGVIHFDPDHKVRAAPKPAPHSNGHARVPQIYWYGGPYDQPALGWVVKGILPAGLVTFLSAQTSVGKTYTAIELGIACILGEDYRFAGHMVKRSGGVLVLAAESPLQYRTRLDAVVKFKVNEWFVSRGEQPRSQLPFLWVEDVPDLLQQDAFVRVSEIIMAARSKLTAEFGVDLTLVIIDTLSTSARFLKPNDSPEPQGVMNLLHKVAADCGSAVLVIDHMGKNVEAGTRGSKVKEDNADAVWYINSNDAGDLTLWFEKVRLGKSHFGVAMKLTEVSLGVDEDGEPITERIVHFEGEISDHKAKMGRPSKHVPMLLKAFSDGYGDGLCERKVIPRLGEILVINQQIVRRNYFGAAGFTDDNKKVLGNKFRNALSVLIRDGTLDSYTFDTGETFLWRVAEHRKSPKVTESTFDAAPNDGTESPSL